MEYKITPFRCAPLNPILIPVQFNFNFQKIEIQTKQKTEERIERSKRGGGRRREEEGEGRRSERKEGIWDMKERGREKGGRKDGEQEVGK